MLRALSESAGSRPRISNIRAATALAQQGALTKLIRPPIALRQAKASPVVVITGHAFRLSATNSKSIIAADQQGSLSTTCLMVGGNVVNEAVAFAQRHLALNLVMNVSFVENKLALPPEGVSLRVSVDGRFPLDDRTFQTALPFRKKRQQVQAETTMQIAGSRRAAQNFDHVNAHRHLHWRPFQAWMLLRVSASWSVTIMRLTGDPPAGPARAAQMLWQLTALHGLNAKYLCAGLDWNPKSFGALLQALAAGTTELYVCPIVASEHQSASDLQTILNVRVRGTWRTPGARSGSLLLVCPSQPSNARPVTRLTQHAMLAASAVLKSSTGARCILHPAASLRLRPRPPSPTWPAEYPSWAGRPASLTASPSSSRGYDMRKETMALHAGYELDRETKSIAVPIHQTVAYAFDSAEHGAALFDLEAEGYRYSRIKNPTTSVLEQRVAALEGGVAALCVSSGQAALHYSIANIVESGNNIVTVPQLYGTSYTLLSFLLPRLGVTARFAASDQPDALARLIDDNTRAVFVESVGNPAGNVCDIEAIAGIAHKNGVPLIVDNTVATPILLRPIQYGADIVMQSLTKFMGGHGTTMGGAIVDSGAFPWERYPDKYPMFSMPDTSYHGMIFSEHFGRTAYIERCRSFFQRVTGSVLSPFNAFLLLQGIETVALRVDRHVENVAVVARFLKKHPKVSWVNYVGFEDSPYYGLAQKYLGGRACSLITFGVKGGLEGGKKVYDSLKLVVRCVNLGDAKSLACHPASTTHRQMSAEAQAKAGVLPEMIRMSVGIEHADDIIDDLKQALDGV